VNTVNIFARNPKEDKKRTLVIKTWGRKRSFHGSFYERKDDFYWK